MVPHDRASPPTIPTPPTTILGDNESPTTSEPNWDTDAGLPDMSLSQTRIRRPLYLIVATAVEPRMGIGYAGNLPWKGLKSDMRFFKRVTMGEVDTEHPGAGSGARSTLNAVIMGRKTWESIPRKFRPLTGRLNVVVTRDVSKLENQIKHEAGAEIQAKGEKILVVPSLSDGLQQLKDLRQHQNDTAREEGKDFIIGGSEIYKAALNLASEPESGGQVEGNESVLLRILQTQVRKKNGEPFECDTFFPVDLNEENGETTTGFGAVDKAEAETWAGENFLQEGDGWAEDAGGEWEIRVVGWEKLG